MTLIKVQPDAPTLHEYIDIAFEVTAGTPRTEVVEKLLPAAIGKALRGLMLQGYEWDSGPVNLSGPRPPMVGQDPSVGLLKLSAAQVLHGLRERDRYVARAGFYKKATVYSVDHDEEVAAAQAVQRDIEEAEEHDAGR